MQQLFTVLKNIFSSPVIYILIIIGLIGYHFTQKSDNTISVDQHKVDSIQTRVDTLEKRLERINPRIDSTNRVVDTVKKKILSNDGKIQNIREAAKKQDSIIHSYSPDQLQQFFSNYH